MYLITVPVPIVAVALSAESHYLGSLPITRALTNSLKNKASLSNIYSFSSYLLHLISITMISRVMTLGETIGVLESQWIPWINFSRLMAFLEKYLFFFENQTIP
jgi:hypothetical protein